MDESALRNEAVKSRVRQAQEFLDPSEYDLSTNDDEIDSDKLASALAGRQLTRRG